MADHWRLSIRRSNIAEARIEAAAPAPLAPGQVRFALKRFALTANNVTYATFGDAMKYWEFFPAGDAEHGLLPVWGFADVVESDVEGVAPGERFYGIWPAATEAVLTASQVRPTGFHDASPHRVGQADAYLTYRRSSADPGYDPAREAAQMTLQPLYLTSYLLHRYLRRENAFGARRVFLTSASSKTAIALAELLRTEPIDGLSVHALTSARSQAFVDGLGLYDAITLYDAIGALDPAIPSAIVDFAGSREVNRALHTRLGDALAMNIRVGGAHWADSAPPSDLPGPKPSFFFAPTHYDIERKADGSATFHQHMTQAWVRFAQQSPGWFDFVSRQGGEGCRQIYNALVAGTADAKAAWSIEV